MQDEMSFWEHLDVLRSVIIRCAVAVVVCGIVVFCLKEQLFAAILWPTKTTFWLYRYLPSDIQSPLTLINTGLAQQFVVHMQTALAVGALIVSPYLLYQVFGFISPALYEHERRVATRAIGGAYGMFMLGVALNYAVLFPCTYLFLATYQVTSDVPNYIDLSSYIGTMLMMSLVMGVVFELPVLCWMLARMGLLTAQPMQQYRKHAIVAILIVAAVITPTGDAFTLGLVSLPIYLLYEISIWIVSRVRPSTQP